MSVLSSGGGSGAEQQFVLEVEEALTTTSALNDSNLGLLDYLYRTILRYHLTEAGVI
jgi:hypothetical protein